MTQASTTEPIELRPLGRREVVARFDGGNITSDAGGLLLREIDQKMGILESFAQCFIDHRDPRYTQFSVQDLLSQRVFGLALGYDLYDESYCGRGDMENRIKENQLWLFADRTSTALLRSNQLRLWFSSLAYMLLVLVRRFGLQGTQHARAQCGTIRLKLLKIGAQVIVSVRRVWIRLATGYPLKELFLTVLNNLRRVPFCMRC